MRIGGADISSDKEKYNEMKSTKHLSVPINEHLLGSLEVQQQRQLQLQDTIFS